MPQSHAQIWLHIVFLTKDRRPFLKNETFSYGNASNVGASREGIWLCKRIDRRIRRSRASAHGVSRTITVAKLIEKTKIETSRWAKTTERGTPKFSWQSGYGAFSVSHSNRHQVDDYIRNQPNHHMRISFQDEYRRLCEKHGIDVDERYVWD